MTLNTPTVGQRCRWYAVAASPILRADSVVVREVREVASMHLRSTDSIACTNCHAEVAEAAAALPGKTIDPPFTQASALAHHAGSGKHAAP